MKILTSSLLLLFLTATGFSWGNGGKSPSLGRIKFAMHDWIGLEGYRLVKDEVDLDWIKNNLNAFFAGTEAPDFGALTSLHAGSGYKDSVRCHCVLFDEEEDITKDRAATRTQEEFDKAQQALADDKLKLAAFYAGAMAHYVGDLSQFMHIMGAESHWGSENQKIHSAYEKVADKNLDFHERKSLIFQSFIKKKSVAGTTAEAVAVTVARFTETGGDTDQTTGEMYKTWKKLINNGKSTKPDEWPDEFMDQSGNSRAETLIWQSLNLRETFALCLGATTTMDTGIIDYVSI